MHFQHYFQLLYLFISGYTLHKLHMLPPADMVLAVCNPRQMRTDCFAGACFLKQ